MTRAALILLALLLPSAVTALPLALCLRVIERGHAASDDATAYQVCSDVLEAVEIHGGGLISPEVGLALAWVESRLRADARSPSGAAWGPLQVLARYHCEEADECRYTEGLDAGISLLASLTAERGLSDALRAYACGPVRARREPEACAFYAARVLSVAEALR